jgi:hypothetical protein
MNRITVGILCGRGETDEALKVIQRINSDPLVENVLPLFPVAPRKCAGHYIYYPPAAQNRRGAARTAMLGVLSKLSDTDYTVMLDDDTLPLPGYFEAIATLSKTDVPTLMTGKLLNADGQRCWDVCAFDGDVPVIIPYEFWGSGAYADTCYFSGPQHILNAAGMKLAVATGYPDISYGEDTAFCRQFISKGGVLSPILGITAQLLHQHNAPNLSNCGVHWS